MNKSLLLGIGLSLSTLAAQGQQEGTFSTQQELDRVLTMQDSKHQPYPQETSGMLYNALGESGAAASENHTIKETINHKQHYLNTAIDHILKNEQDGKKLDMAVIHRHLYTIFDLYYDRDGKTLARRNLDKQSIVRIDEEIEAIRTYIQSGYPWIAFLIRPKKIIKELQTKNKDKVFYNALIHNVKANYYKGKSSQEQEKYFLEDIEQLIQFYNTSR